MSDQPTLLLELFPDNFDKDSFVSASIVFAVEYLLPGAEVELALSYSHNHFTPHDLAFEMGVGVVLETIVSILSIGFFRRKLFEPIFEVRMEARFVVVYKYACCYMHCVDEA